MLLLMCMEHYGVVNNLSQKMAKTIICLQHFCVNRANSDVSNTIHGMQSCPLLPNSLVSTLMRLPNIYYEAEANKFTYCHLRQYSSIVLVISRFSTTRN